MTHTHLQVNIKCECFLSLLVVASAQQQTASSEQQTYTLRLEMEARDGPSTCLQIRSGNEAKPTSPSTYAITATLQRYKTREPLSTQV